MADQVNNDIERLKTEESNNTVIEDNEPLPTAQEWRTLPKVADRLPLVVWFVVICELCERFTFYGVSGPFQNYIQHPPPTEEHGQPGAIGAGQQVATSLNYFFSFFCYFTPLLGAIVADQVFGRYKTILLFCIVYMFGLTVLTLTAIPPAIVAKVSLPGLIVSMIIIGLGTGGIKCNVSPLVADQYTRTKPYVKTLGDGKKVIVDPKMTVQSIFHWFYLAINIGSFSSLLTTYLEKYQSFWLAYLVPLIMFFGAIGVLITFRNNYIKKPPQGSILLVFLRVLKTAFFNGRNLDNAKPSNLSKESALKNAVTWSDDFVDQVKKGLRACRVFLFYPIYWVCYIQMTSNLTSQASVMKVGNVPNDVMTNLNPFSLLIFVPFADKVLYPTLQRFGITIRPITRIFIGFMLAASAMAYSAMVQSIIYNAGPCYHNTGCEVDGQAVPNDVSVWIQAPSYILIGFSEVFTSITGLNYAYQQAPDELKSTVTALYLLTTAAGSALGFLFVPLSKDPHLVQLYSILCVLTVIAGFLLLFIFGKYDKEEKEEEAKRIEEK